MTPASHYLPVYVGLGLSLVLAIACNSFLDIRYGSFGFEMIVWSFLVCWALAKSWKCRFELPDGTSSKFQKWFAGIGLLLFVVMFMPMWGLPRAGAYLLVMLTLAGLAAPMTPTRLHMGAVAALALAMFAVAHHRADWTMLFYLLPFAMALVFTLVAQQLSRRAEHVQSSSLGQQGVGRLAPAALSATALILILGGLLYAITPQPTWLELSSPWGQKRLPQNGKSPEAAQGQAGSNPGDRDSGGSQGGSGESGSGAGHRFEWPGPAAMREAADRPGMPGWQRATLLELADLGDLLAPARERLDQALSQMKEVAKAVWLHFRIPILLLLALLLIALLLWAFRRYLRELQPVLWCRTRLDWLHCRFFPSPDPARQICALYHAGTRLLALAGEPAAPGWNAREYQAHIRWSRPDLADELAQLTRAFEAARYGPVRLPLETRLSQAREAYHKIWEWN